jgi:hypothetical protein
MTPLCNRCRVPMSPGEGVVPVWVCGECSREVPMEPGVGSSDTSASGAGDADAVRTLSERERSLVLVCIDRYIADMRNACSEDQGTPDGKEGTIGRGMQVELRALKEAVRDAFR